MNNGRVLGLEEELVVELVPLEREVLELLLLDIFNCINWPNLEIYSFLVKNILK